MNPETELKNDVRDALRRMGVLVMSNAVGGRRYKYGLGTGSSDLVCVVRGRFTAIELKTAAGKSTPEQKAWGQLVELHGGRYFVVRSVAEAIRSVRLVLAETPWPPG